MNKMLLDILVCPQCGGWLSEYNGELVCAGCQQTYPLSDGVPVFTEPPANLQPSEKIERGPDSGTPWRQANWRFLQEQVQALPPDALILDVGAGRGDFAALLKERSSLALDIYPYPEVDVVCDLTRVVPFRECCFDAVLTMNVMEHVYDTHALFAALSTILKPGGILVVAIPFLVKIHQAPVDFVRYTHYALEHMAEEYHLELVHLEGYYDPVFFLREGLGNLKWSVIPGLSGAKRLAARGLLAGMETLAGSLGSLLGKGRTAPPAAVKSGAATGYHVVYRKAPGFCP